MADASMPIALQLCPFAPNLEAEIAARLSVERWFERDEASRSEWLAAHADAVQAVVTGGHIGCPTELMEALPSLGIVTINGVGFDKVDVSLAASRGVAVTTTPGVLTEDVADLAVGLIISLLRGLARADAFVRAGSWPEGDLPLARKVSGRRFGILGLGQIGLAVAQRLEPFGRILYCDPQARPVDYAFCSSAEELAQACDVFVVACAATQETKGMVNAEVLRALGPEGYVVNVSRGSVIDETALTEAVANRMIAGAALDVFAAEPDVPGKLIASERTVLTPHIASATVETRQAMADLVVANLDDFLAGRPPRTALMPL